ncbi:MAG: type III secretion protein L [Chlamydiales bacterium]
MSKQGSQVKFFSLIDKSKSLHVAPGTKVIPAHDFAALQDAEGILGVARQDAVEYRKQVKKECEELKAEAKEAGFNEGLEQWAVKLFEFEESVQSIREETKKVIIPLALKAAKKIVGRQIELNPETVVEIVASALKSVSHHKKVVIYVNKQDLEILTEKKGRLKEVLDTVESLSIQDREDIDPLGCVIETEGGIINAQIENQWRALENAFQSLMKQE